MGHVIARVLLALLAAAGAVAGTAADADYAEHLAVRINQYRASRALPPLATDARFAALAREHSATMAAAGQMNHDGFPSRVRRSGEAMCVENVGWNYRTPDAQFEGWRASAGHDRNMLDPRVERVGIGVAAGYVTMIACGK
jgi:uncharacterized protein YkwD